MNVDSAREIATTDPLACPKCAECATAPENSTVLQVQMHSTQTSVTPSTSPTNSQTPFMSDSATQTVFMTIATKNPTCSEQATAAYGKYSL